MRTRREVTPEQLAEAAIRVRRGQDIEAVASEFRVPARSIEDLIDQSTGEEEIRSILEALAPSLGYTAKKVPFEFKGLPSAKRYTPDCVFFSGAEVPENAVAIFEIDKDPAPKHLAGGVALANSVALKYSKQALPFFEITSRKDEQMATTTIELLRAYLGDKWLLSATVIGSCNPDVVRDRVRYAFAGEPSPRPSP